MNPNFRSLNRPLTYFVILALFALPYSLHERVERPARQGSATPKPSGVESALSPPDKARSTETRDPHPAASLPPTVDEASKATASLTEYVRLRSRVLMTNDERLRKLEILEDPQFLKDVGQLLQEGRAPHLEAEAIQALLEARRFAESATAERVLSEIVADPRVEDEALPQSQRETLAATKAEVMYLWAAESQEVASKMPQYLPGRVSEGLWRNVQTLHQENALASNELGDRYTRTGSHLNE